MPPRLNLFTARKSVPALRQPSTQTSRRSITISLNIRPNVSAGGYGVKGGYGSTQKRLNSSYSGSKDSPNRMKGPTEDQLPHVSEEAAEVAKIMNKSKRGEAVTSPELEQGTPVSEILERDQEAKKHAPKVMQDQMKSPTGTRSFSTSARRLQSEIQSEVPQDPTVNVVADMISQATEEAVALQPGLKFSAPEFLPRSENFRKRYDSLLEQFTKLLMEDGKLSMAQKNMSFILDHLRTAPPPQPNTKRPLLAGPPGPQLPLNPVLYLTLIVDSVAPLIKIRQQKGIAGGGAAVQIPVPLALRQRRRTAIKWIIDASDKRKDSKFAQRVAQELVSVAEGRSGVWEKREHAHKIGVSARSNLGLVGMRR